MGTTSPPRAGVILRGSSTLRPSGTAYTVVKLKVGESRERSGVLRVVRVTSPLRICFCC